MEVKGKGISLVVGISKKVPDIAVAMSFPFSGISDSCLKKLLCNCSGEKHSIKKGGHEAAMAYAIFEAVRDKLVSSPLELSKSRVSNISCRVINHNFTISWNCQGTGSSLRKTCGLVLGCLHPHKFFSKYSENIKFLCGKGGSKDEFAYCVKKVNEGIFKQIQLVAVGKISIDAKKLQDIFAVISNKLPKAVSAGHGSAPQYPADSNESKDVEYPLIKCSGIAAAATADYIRGNSGGMGVSVANDGITVYNLSWDSKRRQLADSRRIGDHIAKKYEKLGTELPCVFAYFVLTQGFANSMTAANIIKSKQSASKLKELIKGALK